ncbi:hypothetical protein Taro_008779 [Colocasia esculenta]|uniref:RING-type E3 ubiquitin transferase n=1 Tax=Colocasia esculenta TaxID=4460 RepID=A0A843TUM5_COLES|nr:hypothetical protein [Colocasia esculenta]
MGQSKKHVTNNLKRPPSQHHNPEREQRMAMAGKDPPPFVPSLVAGFLRDRLAHHDRRLRHKDQCAERLAAGAGASVPYPDQAVLANLDWGIDALEDAISTSNPEARLARLDHAERMLRVCAMLDPTLATAGVPNSYLCAWAHLHLGYLWALRARDGSVSDASRRSACHIFEMFAVDPFFSRVDFAPELWEALFLPRMDSIVGWYSEARYRVLREAFPEFADLSSASTVGDSCSNPLFDESLVLSLRPDEADKLRELETAYGHYLDDNTRLYAKHYLDCLSRDSAPHGKKGTRSMTPIDELPVTPSCELRRSIPDYVKFGPILPVSAGFPSLPREKQKDEKNEGAASKAALFVENEERNYPRGTDVPTDPDNFLIDSDIRDSKFIDRNATKSNENDRNGSRIRSSREKYDSGSPSITSHVDSMEAPPKSSLYKDSDRAPEKLVRLSSTRIRDSSPKVSSAKPMTKSESLSHLLSGDSGTSSEYISVTSMGSDDGKSIKNSSSGMVVRTLTTNQDRENVKEETQSTASVPLFAKLTQRRPPEDFVCPITGQLFNDPVTLETGQTYERRAIHEWLNRGNITCPITCQPLSTTILPKTNYVLKRLITSWRDRHPDLAQETPDSGTPQSAYLSPMCFGGLSNPEDSPTIHHSPSPTADSAFEYGVRSKRFMQAAVSASPTRVTCQATTEAAISGLKPYVSCLCTSEDLQDLEAAVLAIARALWDTKASQANCVYLSEPAIVSSFMEILSMSVNRAVLRASIYVLSELILATGTVGEILMTVDSDLDCLATLLKNGLSESAVLIYLLEPASPRLSDFDLIPSLLQVISDECDQMDDFQFLIGPRDASIGILEQILLGEDKISQTKNVMNIISSDGLPALIKCLPRVEGKLHLLSILLICIRADRNCRISIAENVDLTPVLELFHGGSGSAKQMCVDFFYEIICVNRRTLRRQILQVMKDGGAFSTMHNLLLYLQVASMEQKPIVASILLQLDLLVEPQKMSIYREDSIDAFIEVLRQKDLPTCQTVALNVLSSLSGRFDAFGNSLTEARLLQVAGLELPCTSLGKESRTRLEEVASSEVMEEEETANSTWEKQVSFVVCNHDNGSIFKALEECSRSNSLELTRSCLVLSTWLVHMLDSLANIDTRAIARRCLLQHFISIFQTPRDLEDRVLAGLALKSFTSDQDALKELGMYGESICKPLRKLKRCSTAAAYALRALMNSPSIDMRQFFSFTKVDGIDSSMNGELLSLAYLRGQLFSSHSDGAIKVWNAGKRGRRLIQEVREHSKAVTSLSIQSSGDKLYSGSLDKTVRVWAIKMEEIQCLQVCDVKEAVLCLSANATLICFATQGTRVKYVQVYDGQNIQRSINLSKNIKCLAMMEGHLYCGCTDHTIQEVDLHKLTSTTLFSGVKRLLGKQTINSLFIDSGVLYAGGSSVDGTAGKAFLLSDKSAIGSFSTALEITSIAVDSELVFTGTKCGTVEVWSRERLAWITSIKANGTNAKITSLAVDSEGDMLFAGSSDGRIRVPRISRSIEGY